MRCPMIIKEALSISYDKVKWQKDPKQKKITAKNITSMLRSAKKKGLLTPEGEETLRLGYRRLGDDYGITSRDIIKIKR